MYDLTSVTPAILDFFKGVLDLLMTKPLVWFVGVFILALVVRLIIALINITTS